MTDELDLDTLDPGIRRTVAWLRGLGFATTDSGDGVSKFKPDSPYFDGEGLCDFPHVAIVPALPRSVVSMKECAIGLKELLEGIGVTVEQGMIEASYDPASGGTLVLLTNVDDSMLPAKLRAHPSHKFGTPTDDEPMAEGCGACACLPGDDEADLPCEPPRELR